MYLMLTQPSQRLEPIHDRRGGKNCRTPLRVQPDPIVPLPGQDHRQILDAHGSRRAGQLLVALSVRHESVIESRYSSA